MYTALTAPICKWVIRSISIVEYYRREFYTIYLLGHIESSTKMTRPKVRPNEKNMFKRMKKQMGNWTLTTKESSRNVAGCRPTATNEQHECHNPI